MSPRVDFDVLIVGGGLVGAALALALGQHKTPGRHTTLRIGLVEAHALGGQNAASHYDARSVALAHGTRLILAQLGLWPLIGSECQAIKKIHISERGRFGATRLDAREEGVPALGYVLENRLLGNALLGALATLDNVQLLGGSTVSGLQQGVDSATVKVVRDGAGQSLHAQWLIGADGAHSALRTMAGIQVRQRDYHQAAVIANVSTETPHHNIAYERFTDTGPLALLPLTDNRCSMVMTVNTAQLDDVLALGDAGFTALLQQRFGQRLGRFTHVGRRGHLPLSLVAAETGSVGRLILIGNARHTLHPVSGQGFNLAMRDVAALAELLLGEPGQAPAELRQAFEACRRSDHRTVETFTDTLARLFTVPFTPLAHARAAGLIATDLLPFVRHALARQSMGLRVRLPRIAPAHDKNSAAFVD